jgi:hypothetical protein
MTASKTRTRPLTHVSKWRQQRWVNGIKLADSTTEAVRSSSNTVTYSPYSEPGWRARIRRGDSATTSLQGTALKRPVATETVAYRKVSALSGPLNVSETMFSGDLFRHAAPSTTLPSGAEFLVADDLAKQSFVAQAVGAQRAMMALVSASELGETIRMLRNPLRAFRDGVREYIGYLIGRRERLMRFPSKRRKKFLTDAYLEWSLGWAPTLADIDDAAYALASDRSIVPPDVFISGYGEKVKVSSDTLITVSYNGLDLQFRRKVEDLRSVRFYGKVKTLSGSALGYWPRRFGVDWTSFVPSLWEAIPWSFAIDYFTNAGKIIEAYSLHACNLRWVTRTVRTSSQVTLYGHQLVPQIAPGFSIQESLVPGRQVWPFASVDRSPYTSDFVPEFRFKLPGTETQWLNLAALARSKVAFI